MSVKSVILAPKMYQWVKPDNVAVGSHMGNDSNSYRSIQPSTGQGSATGTVLWNYSFADGLLDGAPKMRQTVEFTYVGTKASMKSQIGLASFAVNRSITSASVELNGKKISSSPSEIVDAVVMSNDPHTNAIISQVSETNDYEFFDDALINDPLKIGGDCVDSTKTRGFGGNYEVEISSDAGDALQTIKVIVEETIMANPFQYHSPLEAQPFKNINSFIMSLNMNLDLNSWVNKNTDLVGAVTFSSVKYELLIRSWNPSIVESIPRSLVYNMPLIERKQVESKVIDAQNKINLNNIVLNGVPSMFCVMVRQSSGVYQANAFFPIKNISINTDNRNNLLENLDSYQLYMLSSKNGLNKRPSTFLGSAADPTSADENPGSGSPVYFRPSDLGLNLDTVSNVNKTLNFSINVTLQYGAGTNTTIELYTFSDNFLYDTDGTFSEVRPLLTGEEMLKSPVQYTAEDNSMRRVLGGSIGGSFGSMLSGVTKFLSSPLGKTAVKIGRNNIPYLRNVAKDGSILGKVANTFGYGKGGELVKLGGKKGGAKLTKSQLKKMLDL